MIGRGLDFLHQNYQLVKNTYSWENRNHQIWEMAILHLIHSWKSTCILQTVSRLDNVLTSVAGSFILIALAMQRRLCCDKPREKGIWVPSFHFLPVFSCRLWRKVRNQFSLHFLYVETGFSIPLSSLYILSTKFIWLGEDIFQLPNPSLPLWKTFPFHLTLFRKH